MKGNKIGKLVIIGAALIGIAASGTAYADRDWHHGRGHFGVYLGVPLFSPWYYPPAYYYPPYAYNPPVVVQSSPPVYIEQSAAPAAPAPAYWYYCAASRSYYPYVRECPAGWQRVPAQPPAR